MKLKDWCGIIINYQYFVTGPFYDEEKKVVIKDQVVCYKCGKSLCGWEEDDNHLGNILNIFLSAFRYELFHSEIVSEYDQEIPHSQTTDKPMAPRGIATQPSRDTRKTN